MEISNLTANSYNLSGGVDVAPNEAGVVIDDQDYADNPTLQTQINDLYADGNISIDTAPTGFSLVASGLISDNDVQSTSPLKVIGKDENTGPWPDGVGDYIGGPANGAYQNVANFEKIIVAANYSGDGVYHLEIQWSADGVNTDHVSVFEDPTDPVFEMPVVLPYVRALFENSGSDPSTISHSTVVSAR